MATAESFPATPPSASGATTAAVHQKLNKGPGAIGTAIFVGALGIGFVYAAYHLISDLSRVHSSSLFPFVLLGLALLVALGFEFVNGFHDTANAVATVIYTHSLEPHVAVVLSGMWNFIGVVTLERRGGLRHYLAAPGRVDPSGRPWRRFRDGFRTFDSRDHLEPGHLVFRHCHHRVHTR